MLYNDILKFASEKICPSKEVLDGFLARAEEGLLTRDENPRTHFCVYFLPFNQAKKKIFVTHHKKSGLWISPGGHIDKGEGLWTTLNREISEELGMKNFFPTEPTPFLFTITPIENDTRPCKTHFDIWYLLLTDGGKFNLDPTEFFSTKWVSLGDARKIVVNRQNLRALDALERDFQ